MTASSRRFLAASLALSASLCFGIHAQTKDPQSDRTASPSSIQSDAPDARFVKAASASGLAEVSLGKLGASQGQSQAVKAFGQQMVEDHTKANEELKTIASGKSLPLSTEPMATDAKQAAMIAGMQGTSFDAAFKKKMVEDHQKAVTLFTKESTGGTDADLKAFAAKTLPTLQHHLQMAQQLPTSAK
jgi:putative membrane protein